MGIYPISMKIDSTEWIVSFAEHKKHRYVSKVFVIAAVRLRMKIISNKKNTNRVSISIRRQ